MIEDKRRQVDKLDRQILEIFEKRLNLTRDIARLKKEEGLGLRDKTREGEILSSLEDSCQLDKTYAVRPLFKRILELSRLYQKNGSYGLIGEKLGHSKSPDIHRYFSYSYKLHEVSPSDLGDFMEKRDFDGINVTIPYKERVMTYLDSISDEAERIGSVNTIVNKGSKLYGYNTDYMGLSLLLKQKKIGLKDKKVLILGTGGASKTAQTLARDQGAREIRLVSRSGPYSYDNMDENKDFNVLINATPVGMYPNNGDLKIDLETFTSLESVVDLIYNPLKTRLILKAEDLGLKTGPGLSMLVGQALYSARLFTGFPYDEELIHTIEKRLARESQNIILVGMPGSGKTSLGKRLAGKLNRDFVDLDEVFENTYMKAGAFIERHGVEAFRDREEEITARVCKENSLVIATGGGTVERRENRYSLRQNGFIVYIDRPLARLATEARPLSSSPGKLRDLYKKRRPLYEGLADYSFRPIEGDIEGSLNELLKGLDDEFTSNRRSQY